MVAILAWNGLHATIVHFPIALLAVAPILIVVGLLASQQGAFLASALLVMALGTLGAWLAVASGESAGSLAERVPDAQLVLAHHGEMGATTRTIFTALTLAFAAHLAIPLALKRELTRAMRLGIRGAFLAVYFGALVSLASTAHEGSRLAHEAGLQGLVAPGAAGLSRGAPTPRKVKYRARPGKNGQRCRGRRSLGSQRSIAVLAQRGTACSMQSGSVVRGR